MATEKGVQTSRRINVRTAVSASRRDSNSWDDVFAVNLDPLGKERCEFRRSMVRRLFGVAGKRGCADEDGLRRLTGRKSAGIIGVELTVKAWRAGGPAIPHLESQFEGPDGLARRKDIALCLGKILEHRQPTAARRCLEAVGRILEAELYLPRIDSLLLARMRVPTGLQIHSANLTTGMKKTQTALDRESDSKKRRSLGRDLVATREMQDFTWVELHEAETDWLAHFYGIPISFSKGGWRAYNFYDSKKTVAEAADFYMAFLRITRLIAVEIERQWASDAGSEQQKTHGADLEIQRLTRELKHNVVPERQRELTDALERLRKTQRQAQCSRRDALDRGHRSPQDARLLARDLAEEFLEAYLPRPWFGLRQPKRAIDRKARHSASRKTRRNFQLGRLTRRVRDFIGGPAPAAPTGAELHAALKDSGFFW